MSISKSEMNVVLKDLGLSTIKWQTARRGEVSYKPNGDLLKGFHLNSRSPMDVTDAGERYKERNIRKVVDAFVTRGFTVVFEYDVLTCTLGKIEYKFLVVDYPTYHWDVGYDSGYRTEYLELVGGAKKKAAPVLEDEVDEDCTPRCAPRYSIPVSVDDDEDFYF